MGKQVGSRFRQIARKIGTGKFYSGILFTICTKNGRGSPKLVSKMEHEFRFGAFYSARQNWTAKYSVSVFHFHFNRIFRIFRKWWTTTSSYFTSLYIADEVRAIRTSNIRLFWNCFALNFGICLLNNSSKVEIQNKPLKLKKVLRSWITLSLLEQLPFCWLLTCRMNVFVTFLKHHEPFPMNFMLAATIVQLAEIAVASSDFRGISGFLKT